MRFMKYIIGGTACLCMCAVLGGVTGCNWDAPQQEESLPVTKDEVLGFWLHKNSEGESIIDLREDGTYRQVCHRNSQSEPFFDSGWQKWTFYPKGPSEASATITCYKMMIVSDEFKGGNVFGEQFETADTAVFKYNDGQVVLHSGHLDFKNPRPWGNWKRLSQDELPSYYRPDKATPESRRPSVGK